ncbi:MAG: glycoside-pentoside-hexuronide (GPH):cation symporter [Candidatus Enteromonas sp.]|nr:glycoside-pentoside-hexuronide (GPH):cation symporter [Candidatus Enteromonas sp.]
MEGNKKAQKPFGWSDRIGYMFGDFGCNMSFAFINSYLMLFFVTCMGINPAVYAVLILIAKIFDAINDPIIGSLVDASHPKKGNKFKVWIRYASIPLLLSSIALFLYVPDLPMGWKIAMCLGLYCIWSISYTAVNVPYGSMQSVITRDPQQRNSLSTWRSIGGMVAQLPIMIILPLIMYDKDKNPRGDLFFLIVAVMGVIGLISFFLLTGLTTVRVQEDPEKKTKVNLFKTLGEFFKNSHMLGVTISSFALLAFIMTVTSSVQYLFMVYFQDPAKITIATAMSAIPVILGIALVKPATKRFSKKQLCTFPFLLSIAGAAVMTFVRFTNPFLWMIPMAFMLLGTSFYLVLTWALVADCIDHQAEKTGKREEASIYAVYSFFRKAAQGVGASLVAFALGLTGYNANLGATDQAAGVAENIYVMTGALPLIGSIIAFLSMFFLYRLTDKKAEEKLTEETK